MGGGSEDLLGSRVSQDTAALMIGILARWAGVARKPAAEAFGLFCDQTAHITLSTLKKKTQTEHFYLLKNILCV